MASKKTLVNIDLNKNELQNAVIQNLATAPSAPLAGQIYFNTTDDTLYFYDGTAWIDFVQQSTINADTFSNRPAAGAGNADTLFYATDQHLLYYSDGSTWSQVSQFGNVSSQTSYGDTSSNGTSNSYARADHTHGTPALGTSTPQAVSISGSGSAGTATVPSKEDHSHAGPGFGSVTAQTSFGASSTSGSATTVSHSDHTHGTPTLDTTAIVNTGVTVADLDNANGDLTMAGYAITNLADPVVGTDAANKQYVDSVAQGLNIHDPVAAATTTTLAATTGGTVTYDNGTAGVGATLTLSVALTVLDGYTLATGDRIIVKNEVASANNGVYTINSAKTVLTRATDADTSTELNGGDFFFVQNGTVNDNTGWVIVDKVTTIGTTPVVFSQFSGAGTYTAGDGLALTGNVFSAVAAAGGGISVGAGGISVDTAVVVRKYAASIGDGSSTSYTVTHNLGTRDVEVTVYDNSSPYAEVVVDVAHTSTSTVTIAFSVAPTSNQYRVVVQG